MANRFRKFDKRSSFGRNGVDSLWYALFAAEIILVFLGTLCLFLGMRFPALAIVSAPLFTLAVTLAIWSIFRVFSRNLERRRREDRAWMRFKSKLTPQKKSPLPADTADHIFRRCPHCDSTLRLPRIPGKHTVNCPCCRGAFTVKVKK